MDKQMLINDVAIKFGISKRTIRYYEEIGLLGNITKNCSGYRCYDDIAIGRLEQVLLLKHLNFTISDICEILLSQNNIITNEVFNKKLNQLQDEIDVMISLKSIILSIIRINLRSGSKGITIHELLREQIYIHKKIERKIQMTEYTGDIFVIEFGIKVVPFAYELIEKVKELRKNFEAQFNRELPLIRIKDTSELSDYQYRLLVKGIVTTDDSLTDIKNDQIVTTIINSFKNPS